LPQKHTTAAAAAAALHALLRLQHLHLHGSRQHCLFSEMLLL
jgi:hypothetical protein